jgi:hypothetical protein
MTNNPLYAFFVEDTYNRTTGFGLYELNSKSNQLISCNDEDDEHLDLDTKDFVGKVIRKYQNKVHQRDIFTGEIDPIKGFYGLYPEVVDQEDDTKVTLEKLTKFQISFLGGHNVEIKSLEGYLEELNYK